VSFFMYAGLFGTLFLMTQFLQSAQHYTPLQAGIRMLPWTAAAMVISPIAGRLADRYGTGRSSPPACSCRRPAWIAAVATPASATPCSAWR
jgi:MFS family permease